MIHPVKETSNSHELVREPNKQSERDTDRRSDRFAVSGWGRLAVRTQKLLGLGPRHDSGAVTVTGTVRTGTRMRG